MSYICPKCKKDRDQLSKEGKLNLVQGYEQCADCYADLEHESVVLRSDLLDEAKRKAEENDDYSIIPPNEELANIAGVKPEGLKVPNVSNYLPEWYRKELAEKREKTDKLFRNLHQRKSDYNEIID